MGINCVFHRDTINHCSQPSSTTCSVVLDFRMLKATDSARICIAKSLEVIEAFHAKVTRSLQIIMRGARLPSHPECTDDLVCNPRKICYCIRNRLTLQRPIVHGATLGFPSMEDHSSSEETHVCPCFTSTYPWQGMGKAKWTVEIAMR